MNKIAKSVLYLLIICAWFSCKKEVKISDEFTFLTKTELQTKSNNELRLIRNEVFARKGYVFKGKDLQDFFNDKKWYKPNHGVTITLSDREQDYVNEILSLEKQKELIKN